MSPTLNTPDRDPSAQIAHELDGLLAEFRYLAADARRAGHYDLLRHIRADGISIDAARRILTELGDDYLPTATAVLDAGHRRLTAHRDALANCLRIDADEIRERAA